MKKWLNRTYLMGILVLALAAWIGWQTSSMSARFVSNEPGPKMFPYISAIGMAVCAVLSMIFDAPKEAKEEKKALMDKKGWLRVIVLVAEFVLFAVGMETIGFWITSMAGMMAFFYTLKGEKKINVWVALAISVILGSLCYFGMTGLFNIPMPKGSLWKAWGINMP